MTVLSLLQDVLWGATHLSQTSFYFLRIETCFNVSQRPKSFPNHLSLSNLKKLLSKKLSFPLPQVCERLFKIPTAEIVLFFKASPEAPMPEPMGGDDAKDLVRNLSIYIYMKCAILIKYFLPFFFNIATYILYIFLF